MKVVIEPGGVDIQGIELNFNKPQILKNTLAMQFNVYVMSSGVSDSDRFEGTVILSDTSEYREGSVYWFTKKYFKLTGSVVTFSN